MSARKRRVFEPEFKVSAVRRLMSGELIEALSAELGVTKLQLYKWRLRFRRGGFAALRRAGRPRQAAGAPARTEELVDLDAAHKHIAELERKIGRQQVELDFFRQALRQVEGARRPNDGSGVPASTRSSRR
jgi:transposase